MSRASVAVIGAIRSPRCRRAAPRRGVSHTRLLAVTDIIESKPSRSHSRVAVAGHSRRGRLVFHRRFPVVVISQRTAAVVDPSFERCGVDSPRSRRAFRRPHGTPDERTSRLPSLSHPRVRGGSAAQQGWVHATYCPAGDGVAPAPLFDHRASVLPPTALARRTRGGPCAG